jgi:hypothetical protein
MTELQVGERVTVRLPKGTKLGYVQGVRPGFYQCRFDDGSTAWINALDVSTAPASPSGQPPGASQPPAPFVSRSQPPPPISSVPPSFVPTAYKPPSTPAPVSFPPPAASDGYSYTCASCGRPGADHFPPGAPPLHRACAGLGPDVLAWPWLLLAYGVAGPFGCTLIGAVLASIPYYVWRKDYPRRAKQYNMHVWIAFGGGFLFYVLLGALVGATKGSR